MAIKRLLFKKTNPASGSLSFSTSGAVSTPNIWGTSSLDISTKNALPTNTPLINGLTDLKMNFWSFVGGGSTMAWQNYYTIPGGRTDGYHTCDADALLRGKDPTTLLSGRFNKSYGGRDFFTEYTTATPTIQCPNVILGINLLEPLAPYSTAHNGLNAVDLTTLNVGGIIAQLEFAITACENAGLNVKLIELCLEEQISGNDDVIRHDVGITGVDVYTSVVTTTNSTSPVTILQYLRTRVPNALLSGDCGQLWYDTTVRYPDWTQKVGLLDIDAIRQYWNFGDDITPIPDYAAARAFIARYPDFFNFINAPDYNNRKVYLSQFALKAGTDIENTIAMGLTYVEMYLMLTTQNPLNNNKVVGCCIQTVNDLFGAPPNYNTLTQYFFCKLIGELLTGENVTLLTNTTEASDLVMIGLQYGSTYRIGVLNPTGTTFNYSGLQVDGSAQQFSSNQYYSPDGTVTTSSDPSFVVQTGSLSFLPYSFSVINSVLT